MNLEPIQRLLGRTLNKHEQTFIQTILLSKETQTTFNRELAYVEDQGKEWPEQFYLASQSFNDPRKPDGALLTMANGFHPTVSLNIPSGKVFLGIRQNKTEFTSKICPGTVYFIQKVNELESFLEDVYNRPWLYSIHASNPNACGYSLIRIVTGYNLGLDISVNVLGDLPRILLNKENGVLLIVQKSMEKELQKIRRVHRINVHEIGKIIEGSSVVLHYKNRKMVNLPVHLFNTLFTEEKGLDIPPTSGESKIVPSPRKEKKYFSKDVLRILHIVQKGYDVKGYPRSAQIENNSVMVKKENMNTVGMSVNDNGHLSYSEPEIKGRAYLANAARHLVCRGLKPELCSAIIQLQKGEKLSRTFWKGMREMARVLGLRIVNTSLWEHEGPIEGRVVVAGSEKHGRSPFPEGFQATNDFISILGSHRGELGGGLYLQNLHYSDAGVIPVVDMNMEARIQETVFTGIQEGLIQSASAVSGGGLAISIAKALVVSPAGLGARIYLSRKLRNDELLFGETQGLIVVTIQENDLMEFERVCMTIGVPTTSIGRVTDNSRYTFNDAIDLSVKELKSV